jgi:hypothetical protein
MKTSLVTKLPSHTDPHFAPISKVQNWTNLDLQAKLANLKTQKKSMLDVC